MPRTARQAVRPGDRLTNRPLIPGEFSENQRSELPPELLRTAETLGTLVGRFVAEVALKASKEK